MGSSSANSATAADSLGRPRPLLPVCATIVLLLLPVVETPAQTARGENVISRNFVLDVAPVSPPALTLDWRWRSPNLLPALEAEGASLDSLMAQSGHTLDWLVERSGAGVEDVLRGIDEPADFILDRAHRSQSELLVLLGHDTDWVLAQVDADRDWLVGRLGASAEDLLRWSRHDLSWLLGRLGKSPGWVLEQSGHGIPWMLERAGRGTEWVRRQVSELLCSGLDGKAASACAQAVRAVAGGVRGLVDRSGRGAEWWLARTGRDVNWLIAAAGYGADDLLARAGRGLPWLVAQLDLGSDQLLQLGGRNIDWLLAQLGKSSGWLLERAGRGEEWLLRRVGHDVTWLLRQAGRDGQWLLEHLGRTLFEGHLEAAFDLRLRLIDGGFIRERFPGRGWLQPFGSTGQGPRWIRGHEFETGSVEYRQRAEIERANLELSYRDARGANLTAVGQARVTDFEGGVDLKQSRSLETDQVAAPLGLGLCVPSMPLVSRLARRLPDADRARLELLPDLHLGLVFEVELAFRPERVLPRVRSSTVIAQPPNEAATGITIDYEATAITRLRLARAEWAFGGADGCRSAPRPARRHGISIGRTVASGSRGRLIGRASVSIPFGASAGSGPAPRPGLAPPPGSGQVRPAGGNQREGRDGGTATPPRTPPAKPAKPPAAGSSRGSGGSAGGGGIG